MPKVDPRLFLALSGLCLLAGLGLLLARWNTVSQAAAAVGTVVRAFSERDARSPANGLASYAEIRFTTPAGRVVDSTIAIPTAGDKPSLETGTVVPVLYDPTHPEQFTIDHPLESWGLGGLFLTVGLATGAAGMLTRRGRRVPSVGLVSEAPPAAPERLLPPRERP